MSDKAQKSVEDFEKMGFTLEEAAEHYFLQFYDAKQVKELMENFDPGSIGRPSDGK